MKQIYDLQNTIEQDKLEVERCEKMLLKAKQMLNVHTSAMERLLTPPKQSHSLPEKVSEKTPTIERERITLDNWKELGIEVGDEVEISVSGDEAFGGYTYVVTDVERSSWTEADFIEMDGVWYKYNRDKLGKDELYLIRTEDGSLNSKQGLG